MIQARPNRIISLTFTIHDPESHEIIDAKHAYSPLKFIFGRGEFLAAVEQSLKGKVAGHAFDLTLTAEQAYGARNNQMVQKVERAILPPQLEVGAAIEVQVPGLDGEATPVVFFVKSIKDELVQLDGNHPLAGRALRFIGMIVDVQAP